MQTRSPCSENKELKGHRTDWINVCVTKADTAGHQLRHQDRLYSMAAKGRERAEFRRMWAEVMGWEKREWEG